MKKLIIALICGFVIVSAWSQTTQELQARSNGDAQQRLRSNDGTEVFDFRVDNDGDLKILANSTDQALRISDANQHIALGNLAPLSTISFYIVNGENTDNTRHGVRSSAFGTGTGDRYGVYGFAGGTSGNRYGVYGSAATGNGRWGVYCNGNLWYTGSLTSVSDSRLKRQTKSLKPTLHQIMRLNPSSYSFKQNIKGIHLPANQQYGFIAQEMEKIFPELVHTDLHNVVSESPDDPAEKIEIKSINTVGLIPILTKALQEQQEIIENLLQRIETLEKRID